MARAGEAGRRRGGARTAAAGAEGGRRRSRGIGRPGSIQPAGRERRTRRSFLWASICSATTLAAATGEGRRRGGIGHWELGLGFVTGKTVGMGRGDRGGRVGVLHFRREQVERGACGGMAAQCSHCRYRDDDASILPAQLNR